MNSQHRRTWFVESAISFGPLRSLTRGLRWTSVNILAPVANGRGAFTGFILSILFAIVVFAMVGAYENSVTFYTRRHGMLKQYYQLLEASEALAILARQSLDVAMVSPINPGTGLPSCPLPGGGTKDAEGLCFKSGGCAAVADFTYFCWPNPDDPKTKCVTVKGVETLAAGDKEKFEFCIGSSSGAGSRSDILPVQVNITSGTSSVAQLRELYKWKWSDAFSPLRNLILPESGDAVSPLDLLGSRAHAETIAYNPAALTKMSTTVCGAADENCKQCAPGVESGCFQMALCPAMFTTADCQADAKLRFIQTVLFTN